MSGCSIKAVHVAGGHGAGERYPAARPKTITPTQQAV